MKNGNNINHKKSITFTENHVKITEWIKGEQGISKCNYGNKKIDKLFGGSKEK